MDASGHLILCVLEWLHKQHLIFLLFQSFLFLLADPSIPNNLAYCIGPDLYQKPD